MQQHSNASLGANPAAGTSAASALFGAGANGAGGSGCMTQCAQLTPPIAPSQSQLSSGFSSSSSFCMYPQLTHAGAAGEYNPLLPGFFPFGANGGAGGVVGAATPFKVFETGIGSGCGFHSYSHVESAAAATAAAAQSQAAHLSVSTLPRGPMAPPPLHSPSGPGLLAFGSHAHRSHSFSFVSTSEGQQQQQPALIAEHFQLNGLSAHSQVQQQAQQLTLADADAGQLALPQYPSQSESASSGFLSNCSSGCGAAAAAAPHALVASHRSSSSLNVNVNVNAPPQLQFLNGPPPPVLSGPNEQHETLHMTRDFSMPAIPDCFDGEDMKPAIAIALPAFSTGSGPLSGTSVSSVRERDEYSSAFSEATAAGRRASSSSGSAQAQAQASALTSNKLQLLADHCCASFGFNAPHPYAHPPSQPDPIDRAVDHYILSNQKLVESQLLEIERSILAAYGALDSINVRVRTASLCHCSCQTLVRSRTRTRFASELLFLLRFFTSVNCFFYFGY